MGRVGLYIQSRPEVIWSEPDLLYPLGCSPTAPCRGIQSLEQEVAQEEGTSQALKEEAQRRETALQQMRTAVKEVSSISQAF